MDHRDRLTLRRNEHEGPPRRLPESEEGHGNRVDVMELVQKPAVEAFGAQDLLDSLDSLFRAQQSVRHAIRDAPGLGLNPSIEEGAVRIPLPRVSMETRQATAAALAKRAEAGRQRIRGARRRVLTTVKQGVAGKLETNNIRVLDRSEP